MPKSKPKSRRTDDPFAPTEPNPVYHRDTPDKMGRCLFKKGNPGGGRKPGFRRLMDDVYKVLAQPATGDELEQAYERLEIPPGLRSEIDFSEDRQEAFVRILVFQALRGHLPSIDALLARMAPAPKQLEVSGKNGGAIKTANANISIPAAAAQAAYFALMSGETPELEAGEIDPLS